jgi:hypothetical protein
MGLLFLMLFLVWIFFGTEAALFVLGLVAVAFVVAWIEHMVSGRHRTAAS